MKFFLTFGQQYRQERHPFGGHPDGWFEVEAESEDQAREKIFEAMGPRWSFLYNEDDFTADYFPRGKIGEL